LIRKPEKTSITCPFTIVVDGREKAPYQFTGLTGDAGDNHLPILVAWQWAHLKTGDYSIEGLEHLVSVERKSLEDLYNTLGSHRDRFQAEHERLASYPQGRACVVVEASWDDILNRPPERSKLRPKTVLRTAISWSVRYGVPWVTAEDRRLAEIYTFRFLEKAWKQCEKEIGNHGGQDEWSDL
jgi:ERCC4-type nuclease